PDRVIYTVTDEGNGFIFQPFINSRMADVNKRMESHGRGIIMAKNIFDAITYNKKGNQVTLEKKFK
ncbi:MAG: ATP-binding protein, partial [bacterium]|nr:ATP-binding protein [bacterium]